MRLDASTLRIAADLVGLTDATSFDGLAAALRDIVAGAEHPLAAAVGASAAAMKLYPDSWVIRKMACQAKILGFDFGT